MPLHIFITAGEASGDVLGASLMAALKKQTGGAVRFSGVGGPLMAREGLASLFPMTDLSVMGVAEVLPKLNLILNRIKQTSEKNKKINPDVLVTIDAPDFSFRVARQVRDCCPNPPRMIHYVAPTVWAWRPERAKKVAGLYDGIMCLFPFEPSYFEAEGLKAAFVGHPMLESGYERGDGAAFRQTHGIPESARSCGVLFGSRAGELKRMGPLFTEVMARLAALDPGTHFIVPTLPHLEEKLRFLLRRIAGVNIHITSDPGQKWKAFAAMDQALATSGTVGLELAVAGVPHVIAYKMNPLTWAIVRRKLTVKYAHLANLLLDRGAVPEFIQDAARADALDSALSSLDRADQKQAFDEIRRLLAGETTQTPATQAATFVLKEK